MQILLKGLPTPGGKVRTPQVLPLPNRPQRMQLSQVQGVYQQGDKIAARKSHDDQTDDPTCEKNSKMSAV